MSEAKTWAVLEIWCDQQWDREDFTSEAEAFKYAVEIRKERKTTTEIFVIEPGGFIHEMSIGKP